MEDCNDGKAEDFHTCGKCKKVFFDLTAFIQHREDHTTDEKESIVIPCNAETTSDKPESSELAEPPVVQTMMLATDHAKRGTLTVYDDAGEDLKIINNRGETVHLVIVPEKSNYDCQYCYKPFPNGLTLRAHVQKFHSGDTSKSVSTEATTSAEEHLVCEICNKRFKKSLSLKAHMKTHADNRQYVCTFPNCTYSFKTKGSLVRHERRHTDSRPFQCQLCGRKFRESGALNRHKKMQIPCTQKRDSDLPNYGRRQPLPGEPESVTDSDPIKSDMLTEAMLGGLSKKEDVVTVAEETPGIIVIPANVTQAALGEGGDLLALTAEDMNTAEPEANKPGGLCLGTDDAEGQAIEIPLNTGKGKVSETKADSLHADVSAGTGVVPETVAEYFTYCQVCRARPDSVLALRQHLRDHLSAGAFLCDKCSYIALSRQDLTAHNTHVHSVQTNEGNADMISSERIYDAIRFDELRTIDPQSAVREAILVVQQLLILDNISPQENLAQMKNKVLTLKDIKTCPVCDKVFRSTSYLKHHMRVHTGERPYKCRLCPKDFPTKDTFKKHLLIHSGERSYKCGECGKLFKRISHAKEHLKIHSDERPYHCNICQKSFKTANIFKVHERTHTLYLPWVCKVCDKRFREKASLTRHIRTHTGEKPFQCKYCGKQFGEHGTLARHLRCKVPCSEALVEARLQKASDELTFDNVTLNTEEGDKVRTYPTVLTEFSSVVTDTQEYMAPADQVNSSGGVDVSQLSTIEVRDDSTGGATSYIIVNEGDLQQLTSFTQQSAQMDDGNVGDGVTFTDQSGQYILLENIDGQTLTLEDTDSQSHSLQLTTQLQ